ncbi:hypothetical protein BSL78_27041 [Apostichopus japonicus]|uniref:Uncharacterized protein n=1 Tax=Stichopus japonicus TaxID=307972 RepID=A0A2G8JK81_STIJA|nr:hypothetical protein BSL78_27041 [Apostichopus japonicus]
MMKTRSSGWPKDQNGRPEGLPETAGPFGASAGPSGTTDHTISRAGPTNFSGGEAQTSRPTGGNVTNTASPAGDSAGPTNRSRRLRVSTRPALQTVQPAQAITPPFSTSTQGDSDKISYQVQGMNLDEVSTPVVPPRAMIMRTSGLCPARRPDWLTRKLARDSRPSGTSPSPSSTAGPRPIGPDQSALPAERPKLPDTLLWRRG